MTTEPAQVMEKPSGMWRALMWRAGLLALALGVIAAVSARSLDHQAKDLFFDFASLGDDGVLMEGLTGEQLVNGLRMNYVGRTAPFDILLIGSHNLRNFGSEVVPPGLRFFNLNNFDQEVFNLPALLDELETRGKMPRRALLVSILAHGRPQWVTAKAPASAPPEASAAQAFDFDLTIQRLFDSESFMLGLLGQERWLLPISFSACRAARAKGFPSFRRATGGVGGKMRAVGEIFRAELSDLLSVPAGLGTGLIDPDTFCRTLKGFNLAAWGFRRDGSSFGAPDRMDMLENPFFEKGLPEVERITQAGEFATRLREIAAYATRAGIPAVFVVPPRRVAEDAARETADDIMDRTFAQVPELIVVDHRALQGDTALFFDNTHFSDVYDRRLWRCVEAILAAGAGAPAVSREARACR